MKSTIFNGSTMINPLLLRVIFNSKLSVITRGYIPHIISPCFWLVVTYPSEKYQSIGMIIPNTCKNKTCSKPPTRWFINIPFSSTTHPLYIHYSPVSRSYLSVSIEVSPHRPSPRGRPPASGPRPFPARPVTPPGRWRGLVPGWPGKVQRFQRGKQRKNRGVENLNQKMPWYFRDQ